MSVGLEVSGPEEALKMRFSNFVKFTGPEARGHGKGVPPGDDLSR